MRPPAMPTCRRWGRFPAATAATAAVYWGVPLAVVSRTPAAEAADGAVDCGATGLGSCLLGESVQDGQSRVEHRDKGDDDMAAFMVSALVGALGLVFP